VSNQQVIFTLEESAHTASIMLKQAAILYKLRWLTKLDVSLLVVYGFDGYVAITYDQVNETDVAGVRLTAVLHATSRIWFNPFVLAWRCDNDSSLLR
jgi:hypothetical protein